MPPAGGARVVGRPGAAGQAGRQQNTMQSVVGTIMRMGMMYYAMAWFRGPKAPPLPLANETPASLAAAGQV